MTWGSKYHGTYPVTRQWLEDAADAWIGTDDTYPDHLEKRLDDAEDHRNESRLP